MNAMLQSLYHISGFREGLLAATGSNAERSGFYRLHALANTFLSLKGVGKFEKQYRSKAGAVASLR